jgi:hypothetical protein
VGRYRLRLRVHFYLFPVRLWFIDFGGNHN